VCFLTILNTLRACVNWQRPPARSPCPAHRRPSTAHGLRSHAARWTRRLGTARDTDAAIAVLREAVEAGVTHIDTSDYYGPHVTNQLIKQALHPYAEDLVIVTKVGYRRGANKSWLPARSRQDLIDTVHDNLRNLGREDASMSSIFGWAAPRDQRRARSKNR
jgi:predicted aldo/keto reductase-like oxidoreductase